MGIVYKIGGTDIIAKNLHSKVFEGSFPLNENRLGNEWYIVEIPKHISQEKIQELVEEIESFYESKLQKPEK